MGEFSKRLSRGARKQAAQGKISTRLVEFAQPIVDAPQGEAGALTLEQLRNAYMIAAMIWNFQVLDQWGRGSELADRARAYLEAMPKTLALRGARPTRCSTVLRESDAVWRSALCVPVFMF